MLLLKQSSLGRCKDKQAPSDRATTSCVRYPSSLPRGEGGFWYQRPWPAPVFHGPQQLSVMYLPAIVIALLAAAASVNSNATGAPTDACEDLTPQHGADAQKTRSPYIIDIEKNGIKAGGSTKVTIKGKTGELFRGFLIQARVGRTPVGKFSSTDENAKVIDCGSGKENSATHTNPNDKKEITVTWTAPKNLKEQVIFYLTIVKEGQVFWVAQKSRTLNVN